MKGSRYLAIAVVVITMIAAMPAASQVELRFFPADQHIEVGETGSLSVILDDAIEVRTIELWLSYDASIVTSTGGHPGQLFDDSGCSLFPFFEEAVPGAWYGGSVTMGPDCFTTGPGELYRWDFEGLADGICPVQVDSLVLYDSMAEIIEGVSLSETTILVGIVSSVNTPSAPRLTLALAPNPFNPRTTISFGGQPDESVTVEVFDLSGRRLATLWKGVLGPEPGVVQWDGTDRAGRAAPGGAYLFRIFGQGDRQTTRKGILLK
ncbi:MAG: hypothetical protein KAH56_05215 [Candidatus Krumholzibacteria bacterium]|nr:hypothetical protein [Candidatus Krumholzibacteria bacterium]